MTPPDLGEVLTALVDEAESLGAGSTAVADLRLRLAEPLRVALAGRVKAGKSTLLNALVGERLAATDAGECTRITTWYRLGAGYDVTAELLDGTSRPLAFDRDGERLDMRLDGLATEDVERIVVSWPSRRLEAVTLIDTPGAGSTTTRGLEGHRVATAPVDALIYLLRRVHAGDADFLEAFADRSMGTPSPVNAIGVLSRADEIGGGREDALDVAAAIARRYADDFRMRRLVADVIPVAGLLAETGVTLSEDEFADLAAMARLDVEDRDALLLSVDRFWTHDVDGVPGDRRRSLVERLGLFGVRFAVAALADGRVSSSSQLADALVATSGVPRLASVLDDWFGRRARVLKAKSMLDDVRRLAADLSTRDPRAGAALEAAAERAEAGAIEFAEIRLEYLVRAGLADLSLDDVAALVPGPDAAAGEAGPSRWLGEVERWRVRAAHPLNTPSTSEACEVAVRIAEHRYADCLDDQQPRGAAE